MSDAPPVRLALIGAGLIGRRHAAHVRTEAVLAGVVDPSEQARAFAAGQGAPWRPSFADLLAQDRPDAVIIATPNAMHAAHGLEAVQAGLPALIEKPIADGLESAARLVEAAERAGVPLLVGHHRRHNPVTQAAKRAIKAGRLGALVAAHATCWMHKPASYFDAAWRREPRRRAAAREPHPRHRPASLPVRRG